jgi:hypothetical protein
VLLSEVAEGLLQCDVTKNGHQVAKAVRVWRVECVRAQGVVAHKRCDSGWRHWVVVSARSRRARRLRSRQPRTTHTAWRHTIHTTRTSYTRGAAAAGSLSAAPSSCKTPAGWVWRRLAACRARAPVRRARPGVQQRRAAACLLLEVRCQSAALCRRRWVVQWLRGHLRFDTWARSGACGFVRTEQRKRVPSCQSRRDKSRERQAGTRTAADT